VKGFVLLGVTAILATFYAALFGTIWSSNGKNNETGFYFNLPVVSSPTRHATFSAFDSLVHDFILDNLELGRKCSMCKECATIVVEGLYEGGLGFVA
jgi:hypothetical protein